MFIHDSARIILDTGFTARAVDGVSGFGDVVVLLSFVSVG